MIIISLQDSLIINKTFIKVFIKWCFDDLNYYISWLAIPKEVILNVIANQNPKLNDL